MIRRSYGNAPARAPVNLEAIAAEVAAQGVIIALLRLKQLILKYDSDQPRVPAGNPDGGQWTGSGGGSNWFKLPQPDKLEEPDYVVYGTPPNGAGQWGKQKTMLVINSVASTIAASDDYIPFQVGNIALADGGIFKPHASPGEHGGGPNAGEGFDVRPIRKDRKTSPVTWLSPDYDRTATQRLVNYLLASGGVRKIYFNDPKILGVLPWKGHDNHLHVSVGK